jgi:glutamate-1-semialdehyde aminotransferase
MEQPGQEPQDNFLQKVIDLAHANGAVFILDEIVTGFRYALGGAQEYYKIKPDLACFGKGMANGLPLSAVVGKKEIMKEFEEVFFSTTYGGETLSLAAAIATINEIRNKNVISHIWEIGKILRAGLQKAADELGVNLEVTGNPPRSGLLFKDKVGEESLELRSLFLQETVKRGILFGGPIFISYSHTKEDIQKTLDASYEALRIVKKAIDEENVGKYLEGKVIKTVFRPRN